MGEVHDKSTCVIPGCARWSRKYPPTTEWICGRCWRDGRPVLKRALRRLWRRETDIWSFSEPTDAQRRERKRLRWLGSKLWRRLVASVIRRQTGL